MPAATTSPREMCRSETSSPEISAPVIMTALAMTAILRLPDSNVAILLSGLFDDYPSEAPRILVKSSSMLKGFNT